MPTRDRASPRRRWGICVPVMFIVTACSLGPSYRRPDVPLPAAWITSPADPQAVAPESDWWRGFGSTQLNDLIAQAQRANDDLSTEEREDLNERQVAWDLRLDGQILKAAQLAEQPDAVMAIKRFVEGPPPAQEKLRSDYWRNRARLAVIESRKQDALAYYQLSLRTRLEPPQYSHGKFSDDLTDEAQTLWKQTGGTPAAWATWNNLAASK